MSDGTDWEDQDELAERPFGAKPFGAKPFGAKPFGAKPFGAKPFGAKPFGAKPFGAKPFGAKPFGAKPFGAKPFGAKPFGAKPYDLGPEGGFLDAEEWSADIAELICERSAVIRLGATLVTSLDELRVPAFDPNAGFRAPGKAGPGPGNAGDVPLRPGDWTLEAEVAVPSRLVPTLATNPELAYQLKVDLAEALAVRADEAFLVGSTVGGPPGIADRVKRTGPAAGGGQRLERLRKMVGDVRAAQPVGSPGWILHPKALDEIARFLTSDGVKENPSGRSVDTFQLLRYDGADGGTLLGFPFLTSTAAASGAQGSVYLAADWQEAWIGIAPYFVTVAAPGSPAPPGDRVITASMPLDFTLRRDAGFAWTVS